MQSSQARAAKEIRKILKDLGIAASVTSKGYSMGDHVNIDLTNQPPAIVEQITKLTNKFQYGHFDGMIDLYEYSNTRDDIPQTKYLMVNNTFDDDIRQKAYEYLKDHYAGMENAPGKYSDAHEYYNKDMQIYATQQVNRLLYRNDDQNNDLWKHIGIKNEPIKIYLICESCGKTYGTLDKENICIYCNIETAILKTDTPEIMIAKKIIETGGNLSNKDVERAGYPFDTFLKLSQVSKKDLMANAMELLTGDQS